MLTHHPDHPLVRRELSCPLCNAYKGTQKVMCNECHITSENGSSEHRGDIEDRLDAAERQLEANEAWGIWI